MQQEGDRLYGRGTADNKGQHTINLAALDCVLKTRGRLGFNAVFLIETGEEIGSPGLREVCRHYKDRLAADVLIASDGPRLAPERPTIFLGARGAMNFDLSVELREGGHHSGNWGGLLANPGIILAHALATITDARRARSGCASGSRRTCRTRCAWRSPIARSGGRRGRAGDRPGLGRAGAHARARRCSAGAASRCWRSPPAIPTTRSTRSRPTAKATCQIRFVVGVDPENFLPALRRHLDAHGFPMVRIERWKKAYFPATRLDPEHPWVRWAAASIEETTGKAPAILPNLGGSLPNDIFAQ